MNEDCPMDMFDETPMDECDFAFYEDDGQPDEAQEWADYMGGDDYYDHSEAQWDYGDY